MAIMSPRSLFLLALVPGVWTQYYNGPYNYNSGNGYYYKNNNGNHYTSYYNNNNRYNGYNQNQYNNYNQNQYNGYNPYNNYNQNQYNGYNQHTNYNQNQYGNLYSSGSSSSNGKSQMRLNVCQDSVVYVTSVSIKCSSPYTFYYGNGAHRNSDVCDYFDKATVEVSFRVIADIQEVNDFYMTMAIQDSIGHLIAVTDPSFLCTDYVGSSCTKAGSYQFTTKLRLENPDNSYSDESDFTPQIQMAFSTTPNHGYNLGALNTECERWDNNQPGFVSWSNHARPGGTRIFWQRNGALVGTCAVLVLIIAFVWSQAIRNLALFHLEDGVYEKENSNEVPLVA